MPDPAVHVMFYSFIACPCRFTQTTQGCFHVDNTNHKTWNDAEQEYTGLGPNVHLATIDAQHTLKTLVDKHEFNNLNVIIGLCEDPL